MLKTLQYPNRRVNVAMNKPVSCEDCTEKKCIKTGKLCADAERWVSQDYVGQNSYEMPMNGSSDFLDLAAYHHRDEQIEPDSQTAYDAWEKIKSLNLKPDHLEILRLFYKDGKRLCECSLALGIPDQTAWVRKKYAKRQVGIRLEKLALWEKMKLSKILGPGLRRTIARMYFKELRYKKDISITLGVSTGCVGKNIRKILKLFG